MKDYKQAKEEIIFIYCGEINGDTRDCRKEYCSICSFKLPHLEEAAERILSLVGIKEEK